MIVVGVLVKGFGSAKQRLSPALSPLQRRELAERGAEIALDAARAADRIIVVAGTSEAAAWAENRSVEVIAESDPQGQNAAGRAAVEWARGAGADGLLLLSSDLPLLTREALAGMLEQARAMGSPAVLAAPATGRGGTNALYLAPPDAIDLHFGDDSLARFERDARLRGVPFELHEAEALALDLDEPDDLARLPRPRAG